MRAELTLSTRHDPKRRPALHGPAWSHSGARRDAPEHRPHTQARPNALMRPCAMAIAPARALTWPTPSFARRTCRSTTLTAALPTRMLALMVCAAADAHWLTRWRALVHRLRWRRARRWGRRRERQIIERPEHARPHAHLPQRPHVDTQTGGTGSRHSRGDARRPAPAAVQRIPECTGSRQQLCLWLVGWRMDFTGSDLASMGGRRCSSRRDGVFLVLTVGLVLLGVLGSCFCRLRSFADVVLSCADFSVLCR